MNWKLMRLFRATARIQRVHTMPTIYRQSVGEHTFSMACIVMFIHPNASAALLRAALKHDMAEAFTGDTPSPAKWHFPAIEDALKDAERKIKLRFEIGEDLTPHEQNILKFADICELMMFSLEEAQSGNLVMLNVLRACISSMNKRRLTDVTPIAAELFQFLVLHYETHYTPEDGEGAFNAHPEY
jgi:5'-deoxynucleotidase YfbR-like HD superfamily hydrolase